MIAAVVAATACPENIVKYCREVVADVSEVILSAAGGRHLL